MKLKLLGSGTSVGVPQIGCDCPVCTSTDPRDRRRRCGAYVTDGETGFLIDAPPEMREACCEYGIAKVDAIVLTHAHMDHVAGFDDVRRFNTLNGTKVACDPSAPGANGRAFRIIGKPMTCYAMAETAEQMHRIFPYIGTQPGANGLFRPQIGFSTNDRFSIGSIAVERLAVEHGFPCCGYLIGGKIGYVSDCHVLPDETVGRLAGVEYLILNCLREREHPTHLSKVRALEYVERIAPRRKAYFIHMCHDLSHRQWLEALPHGVEPGYDGLELEV